MASRIIILAIIAFCGGFSQNLFAQYVFLLDQGLEEPVVPKSIMCGFKVFQKETPKSLTSQYRIDLGLSTQIGFLKEILNPLPQESLSSLAFNLERFLPVPTEGDLSSFFEEKLFHKFSNLDSNVEPDPMLLENLDFSDLEENLSSIFENFFKFQNLGQFDHLNFKLIRDRDLFGDFTSHLYDLSIAESASLPFDHVYLQTDRKMHPMPQKILSEGNPLSLQFNPKSLFIEYPIFSAFPQKLLNLKFDVFEKNSFSQTDYSQESSDNFALNKAKTSAKNRRAAWNVNSTYTWEINDFDPTNTSLNPIGTSDDNLTEFSNPQPGNKEVKLNIVANDGIGSLSVLAYGTTGGNALNDYSGTNGFHFMTATGYTESTGDVSHDFAISIYGEGGGTGIGEWLNGYDSQAAWGVYYDNTDNYFYLTYEYSNLNFSPVPEPSTYFMTGTLLCFIACNRQSRKSIQLFFAKVWGNPSSNGNCSKIKNRVL